MGVELEGTCVLFEFFAPVPFRQAENHVWIFRHRLTAEGSSIAENPVAREQHLGGIQKGLFAELDCVHLGLYLPKARPCSHETPLHGIPKCETNRSIPDVVDGRGNCFWWSKWDVNQANVRGCSLCAPAKKQMEEVLEAVQTPFCLF